eukprot:10517522-Lingulodinium_polyedra.AAC.1
MAELSAAARGQRGPPRRCQRVSSEVNAHHGAQFAVLQTVAKERVSVVRAAAPGIVIWLGKGTVEMQC